MLYTNLTLPTGMNYEGSYILRGLAWAGSFGSTPTMYLRSNVLKCMKCIKVIEDQEVEA